MFQIIAEPEPSEAESEATEAGKLTEEIYLDGLEQSLAAMLEDEGSDALVELSAADLLALTRECGYWKSYAERNLDNLEEALRIAKGLQSRLKIERG